MNTKGSQQEQDDDTILSRTLRDTPESERLIRGIEWPGALSSLHHDNQVGGC